MADTEKRANFGEYSSYRSAQRDGQLNTTWQLLAVEGYKTPMPKIVKSVVPAAVLTAGLLRASVTPSCAKPEYATKEGQTCTYCHVTVGKPELNAGGTYYAAHDHSLKGYTPAR